MTSKLWETLDYLASRGWHKGGFEAADGGMCMLGANRWVHCGTTSILHPGLEDATRTDTEAMMAVIVEQFPDRIRSNSSIYQVADFNNHKDTTFEDVQRVLEKAAIRTDEVLS